MKINIFPIVSSLHIQNKVNEETKKMLDELTSLSSHSFHIVSIDKLYDADLSLILIQSGGSEQYFLENLKNLKPPYYLLTYGHNNSLAASLEILSYLKDHALNGEVLHGSNQYISDRINKLLSSCNAIYRYGVIGRPSDWLIASNVNYDDALKNFNVELIDISVDELVESYNKISFFPDDELNLSFDKTSVDKALKLNNAINQIIDKYNLNGFTIRCFDLLSKIKTTSCLSLAMLNQKGIVSTCEGDIPTMLTMHLIKKWFNKSSFQVNPSVIDVNSKSIVLAHCTLPLDMCESYSLDTHYESKIGVAIKGNLKKQKITIFKLSNNLKDYFVETGTIVENLNQDNLCRTQIKIILDDNISYFLNRPYGNHHVIFYGDHKKEIIELLSK